MSRIDALFQRAERPVLSIYFTAGFPGLHDTATILDALVESGADLIEIGVPFSDPVADGPVLQGSNERALQNGMTLPLLLRQLKGRQRTDAVPLLLMGYLNPLLQFGLEAFLAEAKAAGIDGLIVPDLPPDEYRRNYQALFEQAGLPLVFLIAPTTPPERIREIDDLSGGFNYLVTTAATTGESGGFDEGHFRYLAAVRDMGLRKPLLAGFGIHDRAGFEAVCRHTDGGIIGSGFIRAISDGGQPLRTAIQHFIQTIRP